MGRIERSHERAERLYGVAEGILERCQKDPAITLKAVGTACSVLEQSRRWCELLAELTGELKAQAVGNVVVEVRYVQVDTMLPTSSIEVETRPLLPPAA